MNDKDGFTYEITDKYGLHILESKEIEKIIKKLADMPEEKRRTAMVLRKTFGSDRHYTETGEFFYQSQKHKLDQTEFDKLFRQPE